VSEVTLRDLTEDDLRAVAPLHLRAFPDSILGWLGAEVVRSNYHWQLTGPHDITAIVALEGDDVRGYLFGGVFRGSTIGFIKKEKWFLAGQVLRHPRVLRRGVGWKRLGLGARLLTRRFTPPQPEVPANVPHRSFGVLAIAVDPTCQGKGIGKDLMAEAARRAVDQGFDTMHLVVHPENESGVAFYRSLGWHEERDGEVWTGRMAYRLTPERSNGSVDAAATSPDGDTEGRSEDQDPTGNS
jgi:ribosomal protein S18 acetylase RimI-like enzyme